MNHANLQAKTDIIKLLGYFPAFLIPAIDSSSYQSLVQQTLFSYIENALPARFKEKLFVVLSRYAGISYFTICHSCTLRSLGMSAAEILSLENIECPQTEEEIAADLQILSSQWSGSRNLQDNSQVETSLLRCSNFIFTRPAATNLSTRLESLLGIDYNHLIVFLDYIKLCHQWAIDNPDISYEQDRRSQLHLGPLLLEEIRLNQFFQTRVRSEAKHSLLKHNLKSSTTYVSYPQLKQKAFSAYLANAPFPVMIHTQQGQILYFNRNWLEATGYDASEISTIDEWNQKARVKRREIVRLPAETSEKLLDKYAISAHQTTTETTKVLQHLVDSLIDLASDITKFAAEKKIADAIRSEVTIYTSDGKQLFWKLYSAPLALASGEDELTISIAQDITDFVRQETSDRHHSEMQSFEESERPQRNSTGLALTSLKTLLNLLPYYLFVVDVQSKTISLIDSKLAQSLDISDPEAAKGLAIAECFPPEYANRIAQQHQQVIADDRVLQVQEEVALPDGIHYLDTIITPMHDERGNIYALLHTSSSSDLAATQEALSQRTLQLEEANKELESFSYSVSHDLQAYLRRIDGFSKIFWDKYQSDLDEEARHYLQRIQANGKRMSDSINALLQLSKVTRTQMKSVEVNLSALASEIMAELQARDPQRQVELSIAPDLRAKGDPQLLGIVLNNLLDNAWKYTSKRSQAKIEFNVLDRDDERPIYYIRDNGAGFELNHANKLFTPFQRLHSDTEFPGTGIGLATVKRIIYRHGGRVWAEAQSDRGATIYFSL